VWPDAASTASRTQESGGKGIVKRFKIRRRTDKTSEEQHTFRGIVGTMIVLGLLGWAFHKYGPILIGKLPPEQTVAVKTVKVVPVAIKASATRGPK
jgi:hypothetical protein